MDPMLERYAAAPAEVKAVINVAIDARRLGHANRLPERLLLEAAPGYIGDQAWDRLDDGWAVQALHAAALDWRGLDGPFTRIKPSPGQRLADGPVFRLSDVIEQEGSRTRRYVAPPAEFWAAAALHAHSSDLNALSNAAQIRGRYRHAAALYLKAADAGHIAALAELAQIRKEAGDREGAIQLYRLATRRYEQGAAEGDTTALMELAHRRPDAGNLAEAEHLYQRAADAGATQVLWQLTQLRERAGDRAGAEQLVFRAADAGFTWPLLKLAEMRTPTVHVDAYTTSEEYDEMRTEALDAETAEVEKLYQQARSTGHTWAMRERQLIGDGRGPAHKQHQTNDKMRAQKLSQRPEYDAWALRDLARARERTGDHIAAEQLAVRAADAGHTWVLIDLARIRESAGDHAGATRLAVMATGLGATGALNDLAIMREEAGDYARATQLYEQAADAGYNRALRHLVRVRERAGDQAGAEQWTVRAAEVGITDALQDLAHMREETGNLAGAERLFHKSADGGETGALRSLVRIRERMGDGAGAERLRRFGLDAGGNIAAPWTITETS